MAVSYSREELGRGISLTRIYDKKFKSNCVKIAFISPLNEKTACVNAMLQTVLVTSNAEIPSRTKLTSTLAVYSIIVADKARRQSHRLIIAYSAAVSTYARTIQPVECGSKLCS